MWSTVALQDGDTHCEAFDQGPLPPIHDAKHISGMAVPTLGGGGAWRVTRHAADRSSALGTHALMTEEVTEELADNCALTGTGGCQRSMVEPPAQAPAIEVVQGASGLLQPHSCNYASRMSRAREFNAAGSRALMGQGANIVQHTSMDPRNPPTRAMKPQV